MKRLSFLLLLSVVLAGGLAGCDLLDPTNVENPNITQEEFLNSADPMSTWLIGMNRQLAIALNTVIVPAEIASDNYVNTQTYYNTLMDRLTLLPTDNDIEDALTEVSQLRETAVFGLNEVAEADEDESPTQLAELWFYKGYAHLLTGEVFHLAPADSAGEPLPAEAHYQLAVDAFEEAITLTQDASRKVGYQIALARAYRLLGQRAEAVAAARAALDADQDYVRFAEYDNENGPFNEMQNALYDRGTFDDLQPLIRLDFLDPKYFIRAMPAPGDDEDADIAFIKSEEAYLILAEAALAAGDQAAAKAYLTELLAVVADRPNSEIVDITEGRTESAPGSRPNVPDWAVAASPQDSFRTGLVIARGEAEFIPVISGTSVTEDIIEDADSLEELLELVYLMRQEIFIAEGRRMTELGIRWPVPTLEIINNPYINEGEPPTNPVIPDFLPPGAEFDSYQVDESAKTATLLHNLNRILVNNRSSNLVVPLF